MKPYTFTKNVKGYDIIIIGNDLVYWKIVESATGNLVEYLAAYQDPVKYIQKYLIKN